MGGCPEHEDVFQDILLSLCRQETRYDASRPFLPWARSVVFWEVRRWLTQRSRERLVFDSELLVSLAENTPADEPPADDERLAALAACRAQLPAADQELLRRRYDEGESVAAIAESLGKTANAVAGELFQIRKRLRQAILKQSQLSGKKVRTT